MANNKTLVPTEQNPIQGSYAADADFGYGYEYESSGGGGGGESQKKQIFKFFAILRKHWMIIVGTMLLVTVLAIIYEARKPDYYHAVSRIQVNSESESPGSGAVSSVVVNQTTDPTYFTTQLQILEGTGLLRRVVKSLDLENNDTFRNPSGANQTSTWQNVLRIFGLSSAKQKANPSGEEAANQNKLSDLNFHTVTDTDLDRQAEALAPYVNAIKIGLAVEPVKDPRMPTKETRLIEVGYKHRDPVISAKVANAIADTFVLQNLERKVQSDANVSDFFQKRIAELTTQIRSGEERLINYSRGNQIISLDAGQNTVVQRLADLNGKLGVAENERIAAEAAYRAALANPMMAATAESADSRTSSIESQLITLRQQLSQLRTEFTEEWPDVKKVKQQIASLEGELQANRARAKDTQKAGLEQRFQEAAAKERDLRAYFEEQRNAVLNQNEAAINYKIIQQEIDTNKAILANLMQKSRETEVVLSGTPNNVYVADRAIVPKAPDDAQRSKNILTALVASLFLGIGLAFLVNWLDDTVRVFDSHEAQLGLPVIGMIPSINSSKVAGLLPRGRKLLKAPRGEEGSYLESFDRPVITEAFNQVRTALLLSSNGAVPRSVLVTSGEPSEGKTVTSLNLAKSLAQLGNKVLLIDADLRCPKMHSLTGINNENGLSNLLRLKELSQTSIDAAIVKDVFDDLDVMTSGPAVSNPATLLSLSKMRNLIARLGAFYRHIVIDSPPALYFADSIMLASNVDAVVLVGRVNYSSRELLNLARKKLNNVQANVVGIVLNDIPSGNLRYHNDVYYSQLETIDAGSLNGNGESHDILDLK